jgi:hypothetical protein
MNADQRDELTLVQTLRKVANKHGLIFVVNGT